MTVIKKVSLIYLHLLFWGGLSVPSFAGEGANAVTFTTSSGLKPIAYMDKGRAVGMEPELVQTLFERMDIKVDVRLVPALRAVRQVVDGFADVTFVPMFKSVNPERYADHMIICDTPLLYFSVDVLSLKDTHVEARSLDEIVSLRVGLLRISSVTSSDLHYRYQKPVLVNSMDQIAKLLASRRVDVVLTDARLLSEAWNKLDIHSPVTRNFVFGVIKTHLAISKSWGTQKLRDTVCLNAKELNDEGVIRNIVKKYSPAESFLE